MGASNDFYKKLALECSAQQISVDLFVFSNPRRFIDLTTICECYNDYMSVLYNYNNYYDQSMIAFVALNELGLLVHCICNSTYSVHVHVQCTSVHVYQYMYIYDVTNYSNIEMV